MSSRPGKGLLGWMGRQVGYVRRAVRQDVGVKVLYRNRQVQEKQLPDQPGILLRRTTVDEVVQHQGELKQSKEPHTK